MAVVTPNITNTQVSDGYRAGSVMDAVYGNGSPVSPVFVYDIVPQATCINNIFNPTNPIAGSGPLALSAGIGNTSITYKNILNVIALDCARCITISGQVNNVGSTFTVTGWDYWGAAMTETIVLPTGINTVRGNKAFAYIQTISASSATVGLVTIGTSNYFGLPYLSQNQNYLRPFWNGYDDLQTPSVTRGIGAFTAAGTVNISNTAIKTNSVVMVNYATPGTAATRGFLSVPSANIIPGSQFTVNSSLGTDTNSTFYWEIVDKSDFAGSVTLTGTTTVVNTPAVTAGSIILVTLNTPNNPGYYSVSAVNGITPGVSFTITSSSNTDASVVNWQIVNTNYLQANAPVTVGQATLVNGTVLVNAVVNPNAVYVRTAAAAGATGQSIIILSPNSLGAGTGGFLSAVPTADKTSFTITSVDAAGTHAGDVSVVNYMLLNAPEVGTFVTPFKGTSTATTNDVRGLYKPSTLSDGIKRLTLEFYVRGSDAIANNVGFVNNDPLLLENLPNLVGVPQA